jgi:hypothetical protein
MKDTIPVDPNAETSLDNVLTDIRFRGQLGFKLSNYTLSPDFTCVELEFVSCGSTNPQDQVSVKKTKGQT